MTRDEYLKELKNNLLSLSNDEQAEAIEYYTDYFEEAADDEKVMRELGTPEELAKTIIRVLNSESKIILKGEDPTDGYVWDASLYKIRTDSGYEPLTSIEDVIKEYSTWVTSRGKGVL